MDITVIILTYNEERHIARAIASILPISKYVFVIDSFSTDKTVEIAKNCGAQVLLNKFINQAKQFNWALENVHIETKWVMRLDADEIIESDLVQEIKTKLPILHNDIVGINLKRKHIFMNRWVRYGGRYPLKILRIWRQGHGKIEDRWMDEHTLVWGGSITTFEGGFSDHNLNNLTFFIEKHNKYATREAIDVLNQKLNLFPRTHKLNINNSSIQLSFKRLIKENVYNKLPFTLSSTLYFLWRYIFKLGFLDGRSGLVYHFLQGWWYHFLVGAKIMELERAIAHLENKEAICEELSKITGYNITADKSK